MRSNGVIWYPVGASLAITALILGSCGRSPSGELQDESATASAPQEQAASPGEPEAQMGPVSETDAAWAQPPGARQTVDTAADRRESVWQRAEVLEPITRSVDPGPTQPSIEPGELTDVPDEGLADAPGPDSDAALVEPAPGVEPAEPKPLQRPPTPLDLQPSAGRNPLRQGAAGVGPLPTERTGPDPVTPMHPDSTSNKPAPVGKGKGADSDYDPIAENGEVFVNWKDPKLAVVITGRQNGYLEPCGCAGLERMKGGLSRRHSFLENLRRERGWPVVSLDVGGLVKGSGRQAEMKFQTSVEALRTMGYDAVALGKTDLRLQAGELLSVAAPINGEALFQSANVALFGFAVEMTAKYEILEAAGMTLGVTSVLGKKYRDELNNPDIEMIAAETALSQLAPALEDQSDLLVLLAHATRDESIELGRKFPQFDVVVTAGGPAEPPQQAATIDGTNNLLIEVGEKSMYAVVLGVFAGDPRVRYQRVPLDSRFENSLDMKHLMTSYQELLKEVGFSGLGLRPVSHPSKETLGGFVGSQKCESCHEESYKVWRRSGHAKAWDTLVELDPPRTHDPECISCHVIGWNAQHYFPYETGFASLEATPKLIDVGCESCHGPGEAHVKAEEGSDVELQEKLRRAIVITIEESRERQCMTCHDGENSPDFDFDTYWPKVEHWEDLGEE